uniref:uncharacterized protein C14orf80 homolog n=1 Tax=Monopterus albus TaxID=43700 RepID=UPI0009B4D208|nr:uncharacterized protein C14orf80 homolog [Monopterus albus]
MQRSKVSVSVEVKQVIGTLCRLLEATGLSAVPAPETFRRAKFGDGLEVESQFWQLLFDILHRSGIVYCKSSTQSRGGSEHRKLVVAGLWQTGYHADWMYEREAGEEEEGRSLSSKNLLLALGWLLATGTLEKLLAQRVQQLDQTLLTSVPENTQVACRLQFDMASLRRLQWLVGCLKHQGKTLMSMLEERTRLLHAVLSVSLPSTVSSWSDQSSTALSDDCVRMQQLCDLLESYLNWKPVEKVFWTWMDSVVDWHFKDPVVKEPLHPPNVSTRKCHHGNQGLEKLEDMLLRLPTAQKGQRRGRGDGEVRGGERLQGGMDTSSLLLSLSSLPPYSQAHRASLQAVRTVKHSSYPAEGLYGRASTPGVLPSSEAAQLLLQTVLERRDRQRLANRMQLQERIGRVEELVLIPP